MTHEKRKRQQNKAKQKYSGDDDEPQQRIDMCYECVTFALEPFKPRTNDLYDLFLQFMI